MKNLENMTLNELLLHANAILKRMLEEIDENGIIENIISNEHIEYLRKILNVLKIDEKYMIHFNKIDELNYLDHYFTINRMCQVLSKNYYSEKTAKSFPFDKDYEGISLKSLNM